MENTELAKEPSFEDVIVQKLRKDIGELMPDDALKKIVNIAVERIFFERKQPTSYGNTSGPSWLEKEVSSLLQMEISKHVVTYMKEHPEEVEKAIATAIGQKASQMMANAIDSMLWKAFEPMKTQLSMALTGRQ